MALDLSFEIEKQTWTAPGLQSQAPNPPGGVRAPQRGGNPVVPACEQDRYFLPGRDAVRRKYAWLDFQELPQPRIQKVAVLVQERRIHAEFAGGSAPKKLFLGAGFFGPGHADGVEVALSMHERPPLPGPLLQRRRGRAFERLLARSDANRFWGASVFSARGTRLHLPINLFLVAVQRLCIHRENTQNRKKFVLS